MFCFVLKQAMKGEEKYISKQTKTKPLGNMNIKRSGRIVRDLNDKCVEFTGHLPCSEWYYY